MNITHGIFPWSLSNPIRIDIYLSDFNTKAIKLNTLKSELFTN